MIDDIFIRNDLIPAGDHRFMHLRHCLKGAWGKVIVPEQGCMKIVGIRRKKFHSRSLPWCFFCDQRL